MNWAATYLLKEAVKPEADFHPMTKDPPEFQLDPEHESFFSSPEAKQLQTRRMADFSKLGVPPSVRMPNPAQPRAVSQHPLYQVLNQMRRPSMGRGLGALGALGAAGAGAYLLANKE